MFIAIAILLGLVISLAASIAIYKFFPALIRKYFTYDIDKHRRLLDEERKRMREAGEDPSKDLVLSRPLKWWEDFAVRLDMNEGCIFVAGGRPVKGFINSTKYYADGFKVKSMDERSIYEDLHWLDRWLYSQAGIVSKLRKTKGGGAAWTDVLNAHLYFYPMVFFSGIEDATTGKYDLIPHREMSFFFKLNPQKFFLRLQEAESGEGGFEISMIFEFYLRITDFLKIINETDGKYVEFLEGFLKHRLREFTRKLRITEIISSLKLDEDGMVVLNEDEKAILNEESADLFVKEAMKINEHVRVETDPGLEECYGMILDQGSVPQISYTEDVIKAYKARRLAELEGNATIAKAKKEATAEEHRGRGKGLAERAFMEELRKPVSGSGDRGALAQDQATQVLLKRLEMDAYGKRGSMVIMPTGSSVMPTLPLPPPEGQQQSGGPSPSGAGPTDTTSGGRRDERPRHRDRHQKQRERHQKNSQPEGGTS